jgi:transposase
MHDNWAVHNATVVREFLEGQAFETIEWPAHSPDLNPIENIWGLLKDRVWAEAHTI